MLFNSLSLHLIFRCNTYSETKIMPNSFHRHNDRAICQYLHIISSVEGDKIMPRDPIDIIETFDSKENTGLYITLGGWIRV